MNTVSGTAISTPELSASTLRDRINSFCEMIPDSFEGKEGLVRQLRGRQESIAYTAPEAIGVRWDEVSTILSDNLPDPASESWTGEIAVLFGKPIAS